MRETCSEAVPYSIQKTYAALISEKLASALIPRCRWGVGEGHGGQT